MKLIYLAEMFLKLIRFTLKAVQIIIPLYVLHGTAFAQTTGPLNVALIGDSLSIDYHLSKDYFGLDSLRVARQNYYSQSNIFEDVDPSPNSVLSFVELLGAERPVTAENFATVSGSVLKTQRSLAEVGMRTQHLSSQLQNVLKLPQPPDLLVLWIGHNDMDWALELSKEERVEFKRAYHGNIGSAAALPPKLAQRRQVILEGLKQKISETMQAELKNYVTTIVKRPDFKTKKYAILINSLINFESFFHGREACRAVQFAYLQTPKDLSRHATTPYSSLSFGENKIFISMQAPFREGMRILALMVNEEYRNIVDDFNDELRARGLAQTIRFFHSNDLAEINLDDCANLHNEDAWHPSVLGKSKIADALFGGAREAINFL